MKILFEEYKYNTEDVKNVLQDLLSNNDLKKSKQQLNYVGYFYNKAIDNNDGSKGDLVFVLPKVLLDKDSSAFNSTPEQLINFNLKEWNTKSQNVENGKLTKKGIHDFIYEFSTWLYRTIDIYRRNKATKEKKDEDENDSVEIRSSLEIGKGGKKHDVTLFDILLSLIDFQKKHRNFITFIIKMSHSGFNKVSWPKTIASTQAVVQDESPIYLNPINKQRVINFDEELLIIYFSILNHIHEVYGIPIPPNQPGYKLITGAKFDSYLKGQGKARLHKIRYKYYSDEAILLWDLCNNFFEKYDNLRTQPNKGDFLLVNKFEVVFEAMIDELIGDDDLPKGLKVGRDDKRIDHLYSYKYLIENLDESNDELLERQVYHIADSKYYRRDKSLRGHDVPKQFTYARNVIQWHMDVLHEIFEKGVSEAEKEKAREYQDIKLFDEVTEGYNIIPNFFISGFADEDLNYDDDKFDTTDLGERKNLGEGKKDYVRQSWIFWERLFDRNTYFTLHYDVNFLYVLKMYAQNNVGAKQAWKIKIRDKFRKGILEFINEEFVFYQIIVPFDDKAKKPEDDSQIKNFVNKYFRQLLGKVFCFNVADNNRVLLYAERKDQESGNGKSFEYKEEECAHVINETLHIPVNDRFDLYRLKKVELGKDKYLNANKVNKKYIFAKYALVGYYRDNRHLDWIMNNGIYNIPAKPRGKNVKTNDDLFFATQLILHNDVFGIRVFEIKKDSMRKCKKCSLPNLSDYEPEVDKKGSNEKENKEYYIFDIDVNKTDAEILGLTETEVFNKSLKDKDNNTIKKAFVLNLSRLKAIVSKQMHFSRFVVMQPVDPRFYKSSIEIVGSAAEGGSVKYGDLT